MEAAGLPDGTELELWWHDEARIGQKNKITRRWARRGTRPSAPHDQRTAWAYIFGAICPAKGKGAGLVLPSCDTQAMTAQLEEISQAVAPGAHAVLLLDQAGWHVSPKLNEDHRRALASMVESGPLPAIHGVVRWRRKDLARWLFEEFRIAVDETTVGRALRALGFAKLSARPRHYAQNECEREAFKKACPPRWKRSEPGCRTAPR